MWSKSTTEISLRCPRSFFDLFNPDRDLFGKSICDGSPLITILEFSPILVKNIFICVAVAFFKPLSGKAIEVEQNFGIYTGRSKSEKYGVIPNSSVTGARGMYGLIADAYARAAERRGVLPRRAAPAPLCVGSNFKLLNPLLLGRI